MEVSFKDLAAMDSKERRRTLNQISQVATAHWDRPSRAGNLLRMIQGWFVMGRVPR